MDETLIDDLLVHFSTHNVLSSKLKLWQRVSNATIDLKPGCIDEAVYILLRDIKSKPTCVHCHKHCYFFGHNVGYSIMCKYHQYSEVLTENIKDTTLRQRRTHNKYILTIMSDRYYKTFKSLRNDVKNTDAYRRIYSNFEQIKYTISCIKTRLAKITDEEMQQTINLRNAAFIKAKSKPNTKKKSSKKAAAPSKTKISSNSSKIVNLANKSTKPKMAKSNTTVVLYKSKIANRVSSNV